MTSDSAGPPARQIRLITATAAFPRPEFLNSKRARAPSPRPSPCGSTSRTALPRPPSTTVLWLVPASFASTPQIEQRHQIQPQRVQEMPEDRADVDGSPLRRTQTQPQRLYVDIEQRDHSGQQMHRVRRG